MPHDAFDAAICRAIKYRSVWLVGEVRRLGAESTASSLELVLVSAGGELAWPISAEVRERVGLTPKRSNENGGRIDLNVFFFRLPLLRKIQLQAN